MTDATPEEFRGATPHLCVRSVDIAVRFYREAFDADELTRSSGPDGRVWHCELLVAGGRLLLVEEFPDTGTVSPETLGGTPVTLHLFVADIDATYRRALDAGASALMPPPMPSGEIDMHKSLIPRATDGRCQRDAKTSAERTWPNAVSDGVRNMATLRAQAR